MQCNTQGGSYMSNKTQTNRNKITEDFVFFFSFIYVLFHTKSRLTLTITVIDYNAQASS